MPEQRVEWRIVDRAGRTRFRPLHSEPAPEKRTRARIIGLEDNFPHDGPFRVERRTVTVSEWETVE